MTAEFLKDGEFLIPIRIMPTLWNTRAQTGFLKFLNSSRGVCTRGGPWGLPHTLIEELRNLRDLILYMIHQGVGGQAIFLRNPERFEEFARRPGGEPACQTESRFIGFGRRHRPGPDIAPAPTARTTRRSP